MVVEKKVRGERGEGGEDVLRAVTRLKRGEGREDVLRAVTRLKTLECYCSAGLSIC